MLFQVGCFRPVNAEAKEVGYAGDVLERLERWYAAQCNGDWEHTYGITIETLDNPGWTFKVELRDTYLSGQTFEEFPNLNQVIIGSFSIVA